MGITFVILRITISLVGLLNKFAVFIKINKIMTFPILNYFTFPFITIFSSFSFRNVSVTNNPLPNY